MAKYNLFICFVLLIVLMGCNSNSSENKKEGTAEFGEFSYKFSMESVDNYKVEFQMNPDSTYKIVQQNMFFDRFADRRNPSTREGKLTAEEFARFDKLVRESNIYSMEDAYGFDDETESPIMYIIELNDGDSVKYVSINPEAPQNLSWEFSDLIEFTTKFMDSKLVD